MPEWNKEHHVEFLEYFLSNVFKIPNTPLVKWASKYLFLGPIQRTYEAGGKLDEGLILVGPQRCGKSAFVQALVPVEHEADWFGDNLVMDGTEKEKVEALMGNLIVEFSEVSGMHRARLEKLKSFWTRRNDGGIRLTYARFVEKLLRRCIIIGTSNSTSCLPNDPSGNRRFVPITLFDPGRKVEPLFEIKGSTGTTVREALYGEALTLFRSGERADLPRELYPAAAAESHRNRDESVEDKINAGELNEGTLQELCEAYSLVDPGHGLLTRAEQTRYGTALLNCGFTKIQKTIDGRRARIYERKS